MSVGKKWQLSRRTFLRGAGAAIALPALYQMRSSTARAAGPVKPVRLVTIVMPHGLPQGSTGGSGQGTSYQLPDYQGSNMLAPSIRTEKTSSTSRGSVGRGRKA